MQLQTVLLPDEKICSESELYYHQNGMWDEYDGYFNLFYIAKHKRFTNLASLTLILCCTGFSMLEIMHDRETIQQYDLCESAGTQRSYTVPYADYADGVFWFRLKRIEGAKCSIYGSFDGSATDEKMILKVHIGVAICTFRREKYVLRNMKLLTSWMEKKKKDLWADTSAECAPSVFIIDNGNTLMNCPEFVRLIENYPFIEVIPNCNTGGTGGFARGMKEAAKRRDSLGLTHLLLMDDDAVFDPDLFVRLSGFLCMIKSEYVKLALGGALFREDYPYIQHAEGEWFRDFKVINDHPLVDMRFYDNCTAEWTLHADRMYQQYGAWWCCCFPMADIIADNMPLPLFVHHDDIQFGMRLATNGIVFLNGISVWHQGFELTFPGVKQYYNTRNELITMRMYYPETPVRYIKWRIIKRMTGMIICCRYGDLMLIHRAVNDYSKGKEWLVNTDPEEINRSVRAEFASVCGFMQVEQMTAKYAVIEKAYSQLRRYKHDITIDDLRGYYDHGKYCSGLWKKVTLGGWLLPPKKDLCIMTPLDSPWKAYRYENVLLYEPAGEKCALMRRDYRWLYRYAKWCMEIIRNFKPWEQA